MSQGAINLNIYLVMIVKMVCIEGCHENFSLSKQKCLLKNLQLKGQYFVCRICGNFASLILYSRNLLLVKNFW